MQSMITDNGLQMYFSSIREGGLGSPDIYVADRSTTADPFGKPKPLANINSERAEWNAFVSPNGLELYFRRGDDTWVATRTNVSKDFGAPRVLEEIDSEWDAGNVSLTHDGLSLYFESLDAALGTSDIYVATRTSLSAPWGSVQSVGAGINTPGWDGGPRVSKDGLSLFFVSPPDTRIGERGDYEMYVSTRATTSQPWGPAVNLGNAVNSSQYDAWPQLDAERATLYFTRSPIDDYSRADIWQVPMLAFDATDVSGNGGVYIQSFDALGTDATRAGANLPTGWTFTANDVVFNNATTARFPATRRNYAGVYNAGLDGDADRALVTDYSVEEGGELDFRALVQDAPLRALRLGFDLEAWQLFLPLGARPGEAAFRVILEADTGSGFSQVADLGNVTTGATLNRPAAGNPVNGNDPAYRLSYDSGPRDVDVPQGATLRVRWMSTEASQQTVVFGLDNVSLRFAAPGDADINGEVQFADFLRLSNHYGMPGKWGDGDFDRSGSVEFADFLLLSANYGNVSPTAVAVPEPITSHLHLFGLLGLAVFHRKAHKGH